MTVENKSYRQTRRRLGEAAHIGLTPAAASAVKEIYRVNLASVDTKVLKREKITDLMQSMSLLPIAKFLHEDINLENGSFPTTPRNIQIVEPHETVPDNPLSMGLATDMLSWLGLVDKIKLTAVKKVEKNGNGVDLQGRMAAVDSYQWVDAPQWNSTEEKNAVSMELKNIAKEAVKSRETATEHNLLLVHSLVISDISEYADHGLDGDDLLQLGRLGMMHAVKKYDWRLGYTFATYARGWIKQYIKRGIDDTGPLIRIPVKYAALHRKFAREALALQGPSERQPTDEEMAEKLAMPQEAIPQLRAETLLFSRKPVPLENQFHYRNGDTREEILIADPNQDTAQAAINNLEEEAHLPASIEAALLSLSQIERTAVTLYFGLSSKDIEISAEDVAKYRMYTEDSAEKLLKRGITKLKLKLGDETLPHAS